MDILIYLGISALAVVLYITMILERSWMLGLIAIPFMSILIPVSWDITHMETETITQENTTSILIQQKIYPDRVWIDVGTLNYGNISTLNDPVDNFSVQEVTGVPGYHINYMWRGCALAPFLISTKAIYYDGGGHLAQLQVYDGVDEAWDPYITYVNGVYKRYNATIVNGGDYLGDGCMICARSYHVDNGNVGHLLNQTDIYLEVAGELQSPDIITTITTEARYNETWYLGVLWSVFLFTNVGLILLFYTTGDLAEMFYQTVGRKDGFSKDREDD